MVKQLHPNDADRFLGTRWEVSGLPLATSKEALVAFLHPWTVSPEYTYRQGVRRTWIVRARDQPGANKVQHEHGLAVIQEARPRQSAPVKKLERWQPPVSRPASRAPQQPRTWVDMVKGPAVNASGPRTSGAQSAGRPSAAPGALRLSNQGR